MLKNSIDKIVSKYDFIKSTITSEWARGEVRTCAPILHIDRETIQIDKIIFPVCLKSQMIELLQFIKSTDLYFNACKEQ